MKKIIIFAVAAIFATGAVFAQDLQAVTELLEQGNAQINAGDNEAALTSFQSALSMAETIGGEDAETIVANCKNTIPGIMLNIAKKAGRENNYDEAITKAQEAVETADKYGNADVKTQAEELLPGLRLSKANALRDAKDYNAAVEAYLVVLEDTPENGGVWLRLGSCYSATGEVDEAIEAFKNAYQYGEADNAGKQLSNIYVKMANDSNKAGKYAEVIAYCTESNAYVENGNAYKLAASAAVKLQKNADAIGYYEKYLELTPNASDANAITYTVAVLYQQAGNKAKALEAYKKIENDAKYGEQAQAQIKALQ